MRCDDVSILLSESAESDANLPRAITRHTEHCLRCQAEAAQYRKIRRTMISMRESYVDPGTGLVSEVMNLVRDERLDATTVLGSPVTGFGQLVERHGDRRRAAYVAAAAATAAGAAGALVLAARSKRPAS